MWAARQRTFSGDGAPCLRGDDDDNDDDDEEDDNDKDDDDDDSDNDFGNRLSQEIVGAVSPRLAIASATLLCRKISKIWCNKILLKQSSGSTAIGDVWERDQACDYYSQLRQNFFYTLHVNLRCIHDEVTFQCKSGNWRCGENIVVQECCRVKEKWILPTV